MRISDWSSDVCSSDLLRQLAHDFNVTKSDLIRSAIRLKLKEWLADNSGQKLLADVRAGLRETNLQREVRQVKPPKIAAAKTAAPAAKAKRALAAKAAAKPSRRKKAANAFPFRPGYADKRVVKKGAGLCE